MILIGRNPRNTRKMAKQISFYSTLTSEEKSRMQPCMRARCVIMSNDSPPPLQTSIPLVDYDIPDEARPGKITPTTPTTPVTNKLLNVDTDTEMIENAVPITQTVLPVPEPQPKIERNGIDSEATKPVTQPENDSCVVDCIYFTQQCCECVIF
ncbi:uncharacterized protein LOC122531227 isoform X1 [Frieseomelitta varia]|uniref:uncharacterized protein LOC122531227 isoform X1 n=1 Tax=Frieseomelitta varia TaxID=561572 RepID=UPI001CB6A8BF|nr:uncharacterized protein LOC122531227 isoform X1 [Frieseomelitta varia]XP_043514914.1 uncharacterized protein LOC122531227 isoform X1 [Frieseomelitta varia]XP_043514915.1 uncharacterized protein LOC122531227 isoform X1 [Frieseomelitta varia]XP_043514916.1 uncharacterized protein LOC122531227 isoform X1 [Frieseomelitta varia]XP_043514917.1 uncharacterized protein LOC122531227 isoform X1 [Frieseomelitta varia]XP_043514918.1 uncharacterized protein LOC122531227 isoform X1 [Frieseomelitta varia]